MGIFAGGKSAIASGGISTTTVGPYTVHTFTTTGANTFTPATTGFIDILLVGGGGGGGPGSAGFGGGGGAGATLFKKMIPVTASTPYPISIGAGGAGTFSGTPTTFIYSGITTTASGGGFGGPDGIAGVGGNVPTASGGGMGGYGPSGSTSNPYPGGTGAGVLGIGYPGGSNGGSFPSPIVGGGGGGAGGAGQAGFPAPGGRGGVGVPITYFTGISTDMASVGGPAAGNPLVGITSTSYGSGGCCGTGANPAGPGGRPGVAYIRYI
jgi:hypothetical protein